jgi:hypothetical protein
MSFNEDGVRGFAWPIAQSEYRSVRDSICARLIATARGSEAAGELIAVLFSDIVEETLLLYQEVALLRRFALLGLQPSASRINWRTVGGDGAARPNLPRVEVLRRGLSPRLSTSRKLVRRLRAAKATWGLNSSRKVFSLLGSGAERTVTTQASLPLVRMHALQHDGFVHSLNPSHWFPPLKTANVSPQVIPPPSCIDDLMGAISTSFAAGGEELGLANEAYLVPGITELMGLASLRLNDLLRRPRELPEALWMGGGAGVWSRLLRHAVRSSGGTVTGHDHGAGVSHIESAYSSLFEFESSDTFVTFTEGGADSLRKHMDYQLTLNAKHVSIISIRKGRHSSGQNTDGMAKDSALGNRPYIIKSVMYPSSFYPGGFSGHYLQVPPDIVSLDWEARLFAKLRNLGFEVLHRPHPQSAAFPVWLAETFGGRTLTGPFEQAMDAADAYVLTSLQSSTIPGILASGKPVVYIDAAMDRLTAEAREMLGRRCAVLAGTYDGQNRLQVDWSQLHDAIERSCELTDMRFIEHYWGLS